MLTDYVYTKLTGQLDDYLATRARQAIRARWSCPTNIPVEIVAGSEPPALVGKGSHYTTRTGIQIRYPSAYARVGRSSMVYCPSTRRITVGRAWIPEGVA